MATDSSGGVVETTLRAHLQRALAGMHRSIEFPLDKIAGLDSERRPFVTVAELDLKLKTKLPGAVLVAIVEYSSKRGGALLLRDGTGSIPVVMSAADRDPRLLGALVLIEDFNCVLVEEWDGSLLIDADAWLGLKNDPSSKRIRIGDKPVKFYIECVNTPRLLACPINTLPTEASDVLMVEGRVSAISPIIMSDSDRYWMVELDDGTIVTLFGAINEGFRLLLRVGNHYSFSPIVKSTLRFDNTVIDIAAIHSQASLILNEVYEHSSTSAQLEDIWDHRTLLQKNLVSYRGFVTGRPAPAVIEMDHKYKILLAGAAFPSLCLGLRNGAQVLFRNVCATQYWGKVVGFHVTFRTDLEVLGFSQEQSSFVRLAYPTKFDIGIAGFALFHAHEHLARSTLTCLDRTSPEFGEQSRKIISQVLVDLPIPADQQCCHPISRFLFDWEEPLCEPKTVDVLLGVDEAVNNAMLYVGRSKHAWQYHCLDSPGNSYLHGRLMTSAKTGQLCFVALNGSSVIEATVESSVELPIAQLLESEIRVIEFCIVIERAWLPGSSPMAPPNSDAVKESLKASCLDSSKGFLLFHGHISPEDFAGITRVWINIRKVQVMRFVSRLIKGNWLPSSVCYDFETDGTIKYSSNVLVSKTPSGLVKLNQMSSKSAGDSDFELVSLNSFDVKFTLARCITSPELPSVNVLISTRRAPPILFFVVKRSQLVRARAFDVTFQAERVEKARKKGAKVTNIVLECALKLEIRDLRSPLCVDLYYSLEGKVLPPYLLSNSQRDDQVYALVGGQLQAKGETGKLHLHSGGSSTLTPLLEWPRDAVMQFPTGLSKMPVQAVSSLRAVNLAFGACVRISVTQIMWARYYFKCNCQSQTCVCPLTESRLNLTALVEADDGTDQCQLFAEGPVAYTLLDIPASKLKEFCGYAAREFKQIDYRMYAECEPNSPQGILRRFLLSGRRTWMPRRAFVVRDKPPAGEKDDGRSAGNSRSVNVKIWDDTRIPTRCIERLSVRLLEMELDFTFDSDDIV